MPGGPSGSPLVLTGAAEADVLLSFAAAVEAARPVAVLDAGWPAALLRRARSELAAAWDQGRLGSGDIVVFGSGSTGSPRGMVRTAASWRASLEPLTALLGLRGDDVVGVPGPLSSSLYLYGAWHALAVGVRVVVRDELRGPRSPGWAAVSVLHAVPAVVQGWAELPPRLRVLVLAGDRVPAGLLSRCARAGVRVVEYYGSAESSFVLAGEAGSAGLPAFPGVEVRVDDTGCLWARSPYLFRDYLGDPGPARRQDGWLTVGDRAVPVSGADAAQPEWRVTGRGDAVTTGGHTVSVADLERALAGFPGVREVLVAGVPHPELGAVLGAAVVGEASIDELRSCAVVLPRHTRPVHWLALDRLPRTPAGKPDRVAVAAALAARARGGPQPPLRAEPRT